MNDVIELCERLGLDGTDPNGPVVPTDKVLELARALHDDHDFVFFVTCAAAHFPAREGDEPRPDGTLVAYVVRRLPSGARPTALFTFRVWVPTGRSTPSLTAIWAGADWQEREQYDLVGTVFKDHPDLRRMMMPEDWEGHPLRRDYAIDTHHFPWR